ncbi:MAG TPA: hypothetical protein DEF43_16305 [Chloroflexus aurantiacus]|nr:MAG: hypothetical protein D6716_07165 [Chloroflexota bacterium]HBW68678.1 hypothetical protein [Chloroflexus aurantiacus]
MIPLEMVVIPARFHTAAWEHDMLSLVIGKCMKLCACLVARQHSFMRYVLPYSVPVAWYT